MFFRFLYSGLLCLIQSLLDLLFGIRVLLYGKLMSDPGLHIIRIDDERCLTGRHPHSGIRMIQIMRDLIC